MESVPKKWPRLFFDMLTFCKYNAGCSDKYIMSLKKINIFLKGGPGSEVLEYAVRFSLKINNSLILL